MTDAMTQFKDNQKAIWSGFAPLEMLTGTASPMLVRLAGITEGQKVLDVGCGTGVAALTAARVRARVTGIDLTPSLLARARENAALMKLDVDWHEGDAEALPFADGTFDTVISQFGHMFAPRPEVVVGEMLRVLRPGGVLAFSTWPPEVFAGRMLALTARSSPTPPFKGVAPPPQWGDPNVVRERLGSSVRDVVFDRSIIRLPVLSPAHGREFFEQNLGPVARLVRTLEGDPPKLTAYRQELEELIGIYFEDNFVRQDFLLTRAVKS